MATSITGASGPRSRHQAAAIRRSQDAAGAIELLAALVRPGDAVLVKGSRSARLEGVAEGLAARLPNRSGL